MESMPRMAAVIVVYNKSLDDSITCQGIKNINKENLKTYIVDNSTMPNSNGDYCKTKGFEYISMHGNKGLSKAYNAAIDKSIDESDVIILMDDDTELSKEYFDSLESAIREHPVVDIFAPIVYGQDGVIYSPNEFNFLKNHFIQDEKQEVAQDKFNAIASMLAIRSRIFADGYRFNEKLFVDQVDQNFFCEQRKKNAKFMKLDCVIHQNFYQRGAELTPEAGWNRLRLRIVDIMRHAKLMGGGKYRVIGFIKCCGLGVQIGKKSKSLAIPFKAFGLSTKCLF